MTEQVNKELLKIINDIADTRSTIYKLDGAIFIKTSEKIINEKVAYLYNILQIEAKNYAQKSNDYFETVNLIISHYKQKLNMVYDEFYCQYVNIQNEIQEARLNREVAMINYQKLINKIEKFGLDNSPKVNKSKNILKEKNEIYKKIIEKCNLKFEECKKNFSDKIEKEFFVESTSLRIANEVNFIQRFFLKISNLFGGAKKYTEILKEYNRIVDKIDSREIVENMREETVNFVTEILEIREYSISNLEEVG